MIDAAETIKHPPPSSSTTTTPAVPSSAAGLITSYTSLDVNKDKDKGQDKDNDNGNGNDKNEFGDDKDCGVVPPSPSALYFLSSCIRAILFPLLQPGQAGIDITSLLMQTSPCPDPSVAANATHNNTTNTITPTPLINDRMLLRILHTYARVLETLYEILKDKEGYFDWRIKRIAYRQMLTGV